VEIPDGRKITSRQKALSLAVIAIDRVVAWLNRSGI